MSEGVERAKREKLSGLIVSISISVTPDLRVLGFLDDEDERFLAATLTALVYGNARIAYGGRIESPGGKNFTLEISGQLADAYRRREVDREERPMIHYLRASDVAREGATKLFDHVLRLGAYSEIKLLRQNETVAVLMPQGSVADVRIGGAEPIAVRNADELAKMPAVMNILASKHKKDLAAMREIMTRETHARIVLGGRLSGQADGKSGIAAEVLSALDVAKPLLIVGAIGGAARDAAGALGLIDESELVQRNDVLVAYKTQLQEIRSRRDAFQASAAKADVLDDVKRLAVSESHDQVTALIPKILSKWLQ